MRTALTAIVFSTLFSFCLDAQPLQFERLQVPVNANGGLLEAPFTGGYNAPQASPADLNNDGLPDLVLFDRAGFTVSTYINTGEQSNNPYRYAPEYACFFPEMNDYVLLRDFNKDGAADIFCTSHQLGTQEMQVYEGYFENDQLKFKPFVFHYPNCASCNPLFIYYPDDDQPGAWNNLFIARTDIPGIDDIDGDGDLDIVAFEAGNSTSLFSVKNRSVEMGYGTDSLIFELDDRCWGRFFESGIERCRAILSDNPNDCASPLTGDPVVDDRDGVHPGASVMLYDQEGDGDKDIIMGSINFDCVAMLTNGGNPNQAWMVQQDTAFPSYDVEVTIPVFVGAYYIDLNNDGRMDMLAALNNGTSGEDRKGMWFYANTSPNGHVFELQTKAFLIGETIDLGTATHPTFADVNADGLQDMVVGTAGFYSPGNFFNARLYLFLNTGTADAPAFSLVDEDWLGLSQFTPDDFDFSPTFGDLDGDQDLDLVVGTNLGILFRWENLAGPGNPMNLQQDFNPMWASIDVGLVATPAIYDLNGDGLNDLIIGERNGNINYYENTGTLNNPIFDADPTFRDLGDIDTQGPNEIVGFSAPLLLPQPDGSLQLLAGAQSGRLQLYSGVTASEDPFVLEDDNWGNIDEGNRSHPALADIDNDGKMEMVVGNRRGGLSLFRTELVPCGTVSTSTASSLESRMSLWPNPAKDQIWLQTGHQGEFNWMAYNVQGQLIAGGTENGPVATIDVSGWGSGLFAIVVQQGSESRVMKVVVSSQ